MTEGFDDCSRQPGMQNSANTVENSIRGIPHFLKKLYYQLINPFISSGDSCILDI
jgi:hypothetical protein